jgi:hypothetical protein
VPEVKIWEVSDESVTTAGNMAKAWGEVDGRRMLKLVRGDVYEFTFATDQVSDPSISRDYIIRAVGRYQPDYSVYTNLIPGGFQLYDNYPNPFNPLTVISYDLPTSADVKLEVFNLMGRKVTTLVDTRQEEGHHQVEWNSKNSSGQRVASGVYFYRLTADEFTTTKKMTLIK